MIFFSSDFHYGQKNIAGPKLSSWKDNFRDFSSIEEMNEELVDSINRVVGKNDTLYFLGDWSFGGADNIHLFRQQILCHNIVFIIGNHDKHIRCNKDQFALIRDYLEIKIEKNTFCLFHYPIKSWNGKHKGSINLHGHSHGKIESSLPNVKGERILDVGWDVFRRPISVKEILEIIDYKAD